MKQVAPPLELPTAAAMLEAAKRMENDETLFQNLQTPNYKIKVGKAAKKQKDYTPAERRHFTLFKERVEKLGDAHAHLMETVPGLDTAKIDCLGMRKVPRCGVCKMAGHNRTKCPVRAQAEAEAALALAKQEPTVDRNVRQAGLALEKATHAAELCHADLATATCAPCHTWHGSRNGHVRSMSHVARQLRHTLHTNGPLGNGKAPISLEQAQLCGGG